MDYETHAKQTEKIAAAMIQQETKCLRYTAELVGGYISSAVVAAVAEHLRGNKVFEDENDLFLEGHEYLISKFQMTKEQAHHLNIKIGIMAVSRANDWCEQYSNITSIR